MLLSDGISYRDFTMFNYSQSGGVATVIKDISKLNYLL